MPEFLVLPDPLTIFEIQRRYHKKARFSGFYSKNNLSLN